MDAQKSLNFDDLIGTCIYDEGKRSGMMGNRSSKRFHPKYLQGLIQIQTIGVIELRE